MAELVTILPVTLKFEGLWANNPKDPGGATMKGITLNTFREFHPGAGTNALRNISDADVLHIYDVGFFKPIGGPSLSQGVAMVGFDYGVNSGKGRAISTLKATASLIGSERVRKISTDRLAFDHALKTWAYFGKGWGARVGECEAIGIRMENGTTPTIAAAEIQVSVNEAQKRVKKHTAIVATSTAVTAPVAVAPAKQMPLGVAAGIGGVLIVIALVCGLLALHNSQRASALKAA